MKRRRFVLLAIAGTATVSVPLSKCGAGNYPDRPQFLYTSIGKAKTKEIGKAYILQFPAESDRKILIQLITNGLKQQPDSEINLVIQNEFRNGKVVIVNGWILSVTEARQSALFYLNS
jgi:hypothetical protein